ncbi:MAG: MBL fold metallo-hydrolase [Deltaproteobacteria bacterium]|nr:MBL fold metallo-hydrolase [Deltaproteobacteria bacterium]
MSKQKDATIFTIDANKACYVDPDLNWDDDLDFEFAERGFIAKLEEPIIRDKEGDPVYDLNPYTFLDHETAPPTVNPSLWRQARLNMNHGLFKVTERIYQVRGYDLSVMSFIEGDTGWIIVDPLVSIECAKASFDLVSRYLGVKPVRAVIYTHTHVDHWGGVKGVVSEEDVKSGKVQIIAPEGFMESAVSEMIFAGNVMGRRAACQAGSGLPKGPRGQVDAGIGKTASNGSVTLINPTVVISETGTAMNIDGIDIIFQNTPGTEAPAEFNFYFPQFKALCMAENCTHTLHNLHTPRGAEVRDAKAWARFINEAIDLFAHKTDVIFATHNWPTWGRERCIEFLNKQRDVYKYIHDEALRLANHGYNMIEIAEIIKLPPALSGKWYNRGYWGNVRHNAKAVYQKYLGWFDGNPANLHPLPPEEAAKKYVEFMGGIDALLAKARSAFDKGEYRWVVQVVNHAVFACPENQEALQLQADAFEQLGYQAESSIWRNLYLQGAKELRDGVVPKGAAILASKDAIKAMGADLLFDYLAIRLNGPKASDRSIIINIEFIDINENYALILKNGVLNHYKNGRTENADTRLFLTRPVLDEMVLGEASPDQKIASGELKVEGSREKLDEFFSLMDSFEFWFNLVTP